VRRLDHINYLAADVESTTEYVTGLLGGRPTEQIMLDNGAISARWLHFASKSHDLVYTEDWTGHRGRLHHIAFATDTREDILRPADICLDHGVFIETGPHKHAIQQTFFLICLRAGREPDRAVQPGGPADLRAGLAGHHLDRGRAGERPGLGPEDHRLLPHARHPARDMMAPSLPPAPGGAHPPPVIPSTR